MQDPPSSAAGKLLPVRRPLTSRRPVRGSPGIVAQLTVLGVASVAGLGPACDDRGTVLPAPRDGGLEPAADGTAALDAAKADEDSGLGALDGPAGADAGSCVGAGVAVPVAERVPNGRPRLPPKWAFGILWGSYYDQIGSPYAQGGDVLSAAARLRTEYAGDLMWIDSSWLWHEYVASGDPYYICFAFDPTVFPDPAGMIAQLRASHFHFGVWQWPWVDHGCRLFSVGVADRTFVMNGAQAATTSASGAWHGDPAPATFDFTNPSTTAWWIGLNQPLVEWGLDFLKLDTTGSQQDSAVTSGGGALFDASLDFTAERNAAGYAVTRAYAAAHDADAQRNGARGLVLGKAPAPGNDQMPGWWTDDQSATFAGLQNEMLGASQLDTPETAAYWAGDTGGYSGTPTDELYVRWLEYTTFTPLQEFFGSKTDGPGARFPWLFGAQAQAIQKQYASLRYRLLPFRYSAALAAYAEAPVVYPVRWIGATQLLVGGGDSELLVQPVTTAGATTASVALPAGAAWIDTWTGAAYPGGTQVVVAAPLEQIPLFAKAGSILPSGPDMSYVGERPADPLTVDVYPAGATRYVLYEDDGVSEAYLGGAYSTTSMTSDDTTGHEVFTIGAQQTARYPYSGQLGCRTYVLAIHGVASAPARVLLGGAPLPASPSVGPDAGGGGPGWSYDPASRVVWVTFPLASSQGAVVTLE